MYIFQRLKKRVQRLIEAGRLSVTNLLSHKQRYLLFIIVISMVYSIILSYLMIMKHRSLNTYAWDLGIYNQAMWSTLNGKPFHYTLEPYYCNTFLGTHFSPILILLLPFYAIHPHPETLLIMQSFFLGLTAVPTYFLAKHILKREKLALIFAGLALVYPPIIAGCSIDFHIECVLPLLYTSTFYFLETDNKNFFYIALVLLLTVKEVMPIITLFLSIYTLIQSIKISKKKLQFDQDRVLKYTIPIATLSILWFFFAGYMRKALGYDLPFQSSLSEPWQILGAGNKIHEVFLYILKDPSKAILALRYDWLAKFRYLSFLFGSFTMMPLLSPVVLLTVPWLSLSLFSNKGTYYLIERHQVLFVAPILIIASIMGFKKLKEKNGGRTLSALMLMVMLFFSAGFWFRTGFDLYSYHYGSHEKRFGEVIMMIPNNNETVLTQNNLLPQLINPLRAYVIPPKPEFYEPYLNISQEYVLLDVKSDPHSKERIHYVLSQVIEMENYGLLGYSDGIYLFRKDYVDSPEIYDAFDETYDYNSLHLRDGFVDEDSTSISGRVLVHTKELGNDTTFWFGPYAILYPGNYTTYFRLKTDYTPKTQIITIDVFSLSNKKHVFAELNIGSELREGVWTTFNLNFTLNKIYADIEFRGISVSNECNIYLDFIRVMETK